MYLSNNNDLYKYLRSLVLILSERGRSDLSAQINFACGHAASSASEFLGESKIALQSLIGNEGGVFRESELADIKDALTSIDESFAHR